MVNLLDKIPEKRQLSLIFCGFLSLAFLIGLTNAEEKEDIDFFVLPSPNEILSETERLGLEIKITRKNSKILRTKFDELAKTDPIACTYSMGRVFSIAGFSFNNLTNNIILSIAGKIYGGTTGLELPEVIKNEINAQYKKMLSNPKWERESLMISFTAARSSLMFLLKDPNKVKPEERPRLEALATSIELGIWYQSVYLAIEHLSKEKIDSFYELYMDEDIVAYFSKMITHAMKTFPDNKLLLKLEELNDACEKIMEDEKLEQEELDDLRPLLEAVVQ